MRMHVFIVNDSTFPTHLRYMFAGTGAKEHDEAIVLLSDIKRVRPGDSVVFYIEGTVNTRGGFYGVFSIGEQQPLVFCTPGNTHPMPELGKKLIYRTLLQPQEVYAEGVPEWEALDKLPMYSTEIQWSLIYRKLRAKRGCTPLLPEEGKSLLDMIRSKNKGIVLARSDATCGFNWDIDQRRIVTTAQRTEYPYPRMYGYDVVPHIRERQRQRKAYESLLQLYFTEQVGVDRRLESVVGENVTWFGNEVACGVGMQKIDVLVLCENDRGRMYRLVELKDEPVEPSIVNQVEYYVNWGAQELGRHLPEAHSWNLQPVVVAPPPQGK